MNDELILTVENRAITGWDRVRVTRSIERLPSDFDLGLMDYYATGDKERQIVNPGDKCTVALGDDLVITGYLDRWTSGLFRSQHEVRAMGRSKCQDLVDCSAEWQNNVINTSTALDIAKKLAAPYGISVTSDVTDMVTVPQFTINFGESPQAIIDRISRYSAFLYYDKPDGNLYLTRVGAKSAASGVEQGVNIEQAFFQSSVDERFSDYVGLSLSLNKLEGDYSSLTLATAQDPDVATMRYRKHITIVESTMAANKLAEQCINWEMNRRYGRSRQLQVTIDSWRDSSGALWQPNTLIPISIPVMGLEDESWLLGEVTFTRDDSGTHAQMLLMPPEAFIVQPYQFYSLLQELTQ
ncbi:phage baseplate assembly protein [Symbiopectobacterium purcellii]|uniref:Phage tail protein n=1 Tax=Symbiopectobacterium purcellii TaxID=2871826 RepID=A0ABX9ARF9_9ENTR|nr:phage tail protein [Symbiopectobacterium purcellii]QZN97361.1 phage tail protein [Symbiopectobacterium purcellii]